MTSRRWQTDPGRQGVLFIRCHKTLLQFWMMRLNGELMVNKLPMSQFLLNRKSNLRKPFFIWISLLVAFVLGMGLWLALGRSLLPESVGTTINPPQPMPNFELLNQDGQLTQLKDLRGKPTLLVFGYTHCPDICPISLVNFKRIKAELGQKGNNLQFVLVSVDGERDTPPVLKHYLNSFDPTFIALTERAFVVAQMAAPYGARFERKITRTLQTEYVVGHTTDMYLLDADGRLVKKYAYGTEATLIAQDVMSYL
jgi:protein SCO1/2